MDAARRDHRGELRRTPLEFRRRYDVEVNQRLAREGLPALGHRRQHQHRGRMVLGNLGSEMRFPTPFSARA